jgi:hypothetical protein
MTTQAYLQIQDNVVTNNVMWDGDTTQWTPPSDATMLVQATTPALVWEAVITDKKITDYVLVEKIGAGQVLFTWDGTVLTTNQSKPSV